MAFVFASNNPTSFGFNPTVDNTAGRFRSSRVSHGFSCYGAEPNEQFETMTVKHQPVSGDVTWIHAVLWHSRGGGGNNANGRFWFEASDANGDDLFAFFIGGTQGPQLRVYGDTTVTHIPAGQSTPWTVVQNLMSLDVKCDMSGGNITVEAYRDNAASPYFFATAANTGGKGNPVVEFWRASEFQSHTDGRQVVSEVMVADEDTRGLGLTDLMTYTPGTHSDWVGALASLTDQDAETGMFSENVGDKISQNIDVYNGPPLVTVRTVVLSFLGNNGGAVGDVQPFLREKVGGTEHTVSALGLTNVLSYHARDYALNPQTGSPWLIGEVTDFEYGFESLV